MKKMTHLFPFLLSAFVFMAAVPAVSAAGASPAAPGGSGGTSPGGGSSSSNITYTAVNSYTSDASLTDQTVSSTGTDESAVFNNGGNVILQKLNILRESSDSTGGDNSSFYGVGAAVLTKSGSTYINNSTITTDAKGGAGVFSYADGTTYVANTTIDTKQSTSGGIHAAGGGTLYAWDLDVTTAGGSSAAIRSDRGGGTMVVDGGSYTSNGTGSPAIYSTADISVKDASLTANNSEAICIEGLNSIDLFDCDLTGNIPVNSQNDVDWNVILYQSMSGDSVQGESKFQMTGGTLTAKNGGMFYTTNTESSFLIDNVDITYADDNDFFLRCTGNSNARGWGSSGSNGADCSFTALDQNMQGDVQWDSISKLDFYMENGSVLTGAFVDDEACAGNGGSGYANAYISSDSTWIVTGSSTLTNLYNAGTIRDADGKTVTIIDSTGTRVSGDSAYTITVAGTYSTSADFSGASTENSWSSYAVDQPEQLTTDLSGDTDDTGNTDDTDDDADVTPSTGFTDVPDSYWAKDSIAYVVENGYFKGTGSDTFSPEASTTRGMIMTVLARMAGTDTDGGDPWYQKGMEWAVSAGVSDGTSPEAVITREQLATMLYRYLGSPEAGNSTVDSFTDSGSVSDYATAAMNWAVDKGIINGMGDGTLNPQGEATRAQVAAMIERVSKL